MTLYFRLVLLLLKKFIFQRQPISPSEPSIIHFRNWPLDCDYNLHMTNARYFALCDLGRVGLMIDTKAIGKLLFNGMVPVGSSETASFIKEIKIFEPFALISQVVGWDERFWYFEHKFVQGDKVRAIIYVKGVFLRKRKVLAFQEVLRVAGHDVSSPDLPAHVKAWSEIADGVYRTFK